MNGSPLARVVCLVSLSCTALAQSQLAPRTSDALLAPAESEALRLGAAQLNGDSDEGWDWTRPDSRAPAGVQLTDVLDADDWMVHVRYVHVEQDGLRDKKDDLSSQELFDAGYSVAPEEMTTDVVDVQAFYGLDDRWTLFAELPWIARDLDSVTETGAELTRESDGIGDLRFGALRTLHQEDGRRFVANLGLSVPTGSIDEKDDDASGNRALLPYSMQLGTGTFDIHPGVSWMAQYDTWSWGAQGQWRLHLGRNDEDWARSDEGDVSVWLSKGFSPMVAGTLRARAYFWGDVHGSADELDPTVDPLNDRTKQGGERYDLLGGLTWKIGSGYEAIRTLDLEIGKPVIEWLDGPGLSTDVYLVFGWRYSF